MAGYDKVICVIEKNKLMKSFKSHKDRISALKLLKYVYLV